MHGCGNACNVNTSPATEQLAKQVQHSSDAEMEPRGSVPAAVRQLQLEAVEPGVPRLRQHGVFRGEQRLQKSNTFTARGCAVEHLLALLAGRPAWL